MTANALGLAVGGPILTALTIKLNKRAVLIGSLGLFIVANLVPMLTASYGLFIAARAAAGALQGLFIAVGFVAGIAIVPPERMGRAISVVISGVAVSAALGVPLGTLVGQALGWRGTFTAVVVLAMLALIATLGLVPSVPSTGGGRFADTNAARTLIVATIGVAVSLLALYLLGTIAFLVALAPVALGLFGFGMAPSLQYRVVRLAGPGGALASSLPASAISVGIAFGSFAGGVAIGNYTASATVITGLIIAVIAIPVAWATSFLKPPDVQQAAQPAAAAEPAEPTLEAA